MCENNENIPKGVFSLVRFRETERTLSAKFKKERFIIMKKEKAKQGIPRLLELAAELLQNTANNTSLDASK